MRHLRPALALAVLLAGRASAHDLWIEPSAFRPAAGDRVTAAFRVGQKLQGDPLPRIPPLIRRFELDAAPMIGRAGMDPAGIALVNRSGLQWIGYESNAFPMTNEAKKFEDYLRDEGLETMIAARARNGQSAAPGRERFYRCAKALLAADGATTGTYDAPLGFTFELIPRRNPYAMHAGGELPLTLLFNGKPAAHVLVTAMSKDDPDKAVHARTDSRGRVALPIAHTGFWLIKAVHMQAAPPDAAGVDWESWWASLTFELR